MEIAPRYASYRRLLGTVGIIDNPGHPLRAVKEGFTVLDIRQVGAPVGRAGIDSVSGGKIYGGQEQRVGVHEKYLVDKGHQRWLEPIQLAANHGFSAGELILLGLVKGISVATCYYLEALAKCEIVWRRMHFQIVGEIADIQLIAAGTRIRILSLLQSGMAEDVGGS